MRALVTGATGFVGAAIARALGAAGWQVRVLARSSSNRANLQQLPVEVVEGDLRDVASLERALAGCEGLFHAAADYRLGARDPRQLYLTNVEGTRNILNAARSAGVARSVYTSSVATIGIPPDGSPGDEGTPVALSNMIGHYKRSKYLAEEVARDAARAGMPVVIVNPSTPVGPGDIKPTPTGQLILDAASGRMPAYVDTGLNIVHVDDVAAGHLLAFARGTPGERYILGGEDMTLQVILAQISRIVGRKPPRIRLPYAAVLPMAYIAEAVAQISGRSGRLTLEGVRMSRKRMFFSSAKAARELGYRWGPPLEAFEDAVRWFRERGLLREGSAADRSRPDGSTPRHGA
jgi:dihydroflavonol-4-reductase